MKFSIITVSYNSERYIRQTIESVLGQTYPDIEYIIIDGNSTDNTCDIIKEYNDRLSVFISEPDTNMYDAINKGMHLCTGNYISILNSDDYYVNNHVISDIAEQINNSPECVGVYGNLIKVDAKGDIIRYRKGFQVGYKDLLYSRRTSFVGHATFFIPRTCLLSIGYYDFQNFNYAGDFDFILRCLQYGRFKHVDIYVMCFRTHQASITASGKLANETLNVLESHGYFDIGLFKRCIKYYYLWTRFTLINARFLINKIYR